MKVLFALGNEQISKRVAEKYYDKYGEELEYKNVFYFKALLDEVKRDKTYDRIIISEDLEQFHVKNLESLDKFIFNNVDNVTDEIEDSEVIFICSDRRTKQNDRFVERLFNIGVYNTLIGDERRQDSLCDYIKKPMNKKEAKRHLNITSVISDGEIASSDDSVEEVQIMHIIKYYETNIKDKVEEYIPAFDKIAEQYSRNQLKVIVHYLPLDVKRVILSSPKYSFLADGLPESSIVAKEPQKPTKATNTKGTRKGLFGILKDNKNKEFVRKQPEILNKEQVDAIRNSHQDLEVKQQSTVREINKQENKDIEVDIIPQVSKNKNVNDGTSDVVVEKISNPHQQVQTNIIVEEDDFAKQQAELKARAEQEALTKQQAELKARAEQEALAKQQAELKAKAEQEALAKQQAELKARAEQEALAKQQAELKARAEQEALAKQQAELKARAEQEALAKQQAELKARAEQEALAKQQAELKAKAEQESLIRQQAELERLNAERMKLEQEKQALEEERRKLREQSEKLSMKSAPTAVANVAIPANQIYDTQKIDYKKMVIFVGANKSGTTFLVNAVAHILAESKINVGVLDMTKDKSLYYIYNQDDRGLRQIASECMHKLSEGIDSYIPAKKNLKIYTTVPGITDSRKIFRNRTIIDSVKGFNDLVIIDADFSTPLEYYEKADEIYIVQDLDIVRVQETTLFLRELKNRSINTNKIRIIINKYVKSLLTPKRLIEGLSYYNDPQMSFTDELLDNKVPYFVVPMNMENYANYIDGMYKNNLDYRKYTQDFLNSIGEISKCVFKRGGTVTKKRGFFG